MTATSSTPCPICGQQDQVIKVSEFKASLADPDSTVNTLLAGKTPEERAAITRRLAAPAKPLPLLPEKPSSGYILTLLFLVALNWGFGVQVIRGEAILLVQVLLLLCMATLLVVAVLFVYKYSMYRKELIVANQPDPEWQRGRDRWKRQYYCLRDDNLFEVTQ